jgi:hypothetical protein
MKAIFKLMLFSFALNFAVGIMSNAIPTLYMDSSTNPLGLYDEASVLQFDSEVNKTIQPSGDLEDSSDAFDRLLDKIGLGVAKKFLNAIDTYLFGFIRFIEWLMPYEVALWLGPMLRILISIGYAFGAIWLWTGKDLARG